MIRIILDRSIKIWYCFINNVTSIDGFRKDKKMRYVIFVLNQNSSTQRFRVEKVGEESAWELKRERRISSFTDFFFFGYSELESEEELLKSIEIVNGEIRFNKIYEIEKNTIYIPGHELPRYGVVYNPLTGVSIDKRSFASFNVIVIENV